MIQHHRLRIGIRAEITLFHRLDLALPHRGLAPCENRVYTGLNRLGDGQFLDLLHPNEERVTRTTFVPDTAY
ncbi:MAG: hypothetical protein ABW185_24950 [Sedimenticola sp.]